jgi:hypothetical protein
MPYFKVTIVLYNAGYCGRRTNMKSKTNYTETNSLNRTHTKSVNQKEPDIARMIQPDHTWTPRIFTHKEVCPICGNEHVHLIAVKCLRKNDETVIAGEITVKEALNDMRGSKIIIEYWAECGHKWEVVRQFDKGNTFLICNVLSEDQESKSGLWRD